MLFRDKSSRSNRQIRTNLPIKITRLNLVFKRQILDKKINYVKVF